MDLHFTFSVVIYLLVIFIIHYIIIINKNLSDNNISQNIVSEESNVVAEESNGIVSNEMDDMIISNEDIQQLDNPIVDFNNDEFNEQNAKDELLKYLNNENLNN